MASPKLSSGYLSGSLEFSVREIHSEECRKMRWNKIRGKSWGSPQGIREQNNWQQDYLRGGKTGFWGQKEPLPALKKGTQACDPSVRGAVREESRKSKKIFSSAGPWMGLRFPLRGTGWCMCQAGARAGRFEHTVLRQEKRSPGLKTDLGERRQVNYWEQWGEGRTVLEWGVRASDRREVTARPGEDGRVGRGWGVSKERWWWSDRGNWVGGRSESNCLTAPNGGKGGCKCVISSVFHDPVSKGRTLNSTSIKMCDKLKFYMCFFLLSQAKINVCILYPYFFPTI